MKVSRKEIREKVIEALRECLEKLEVEDITDDTDTSHDLGLDSKDGIDLALLLSEKLGCEIPHRVNPLVDDDKRCMRRVGEMVDLMCDLIAQEEKVANG